jgi:RNA polymerase sigma-70 factor (ECF subfamily)
MRTDPDVQLMLAFKAGDEQAFHQLFDRYKKQVVNYCYRFCGDREVAEELAQEAFLRIYKAAPRYRPKARFRTWLFKITANVCLNEVRRPVYRQQLESLDQLPERDSGMAGPDIELANAERQHLVRLAMRDLPDKQRTALLLRIEGEFSYKEIALQIGRSVGHVKTLIHRGRLALRQKLTPYLGE